MELEDTKGSGSNEGHLLEISSACNQPLESRSCMTFKDRGVAWLEVHAEIMRLDESFDKI